MIAGAFAASTSAGTWPSAFNAATRTFLSVCSSRGKIASTPAASPMGANDVECNVQDHSAT
eukprot:4826029-Prymnesium_polylepis.1